MESKQLAIKNQANRPGIKMQCVSCNQRMKKLAKGFHGSVCERNHFQCLYCNRKADRKCVICHLKTEIRGFKDPRKIIEEKHKSMMAKKEAERKAMEKVMERLFDGALKVTIAQKNNTIPK